MARVIFDRKQWQPTAVQPDSQPVQPPVELQDTPPSGAETQQEEKQTGESYVRQYLEQNKQPARSDYYEGADWLKTLTPPMSREEEEKRKKAATAVEAVGHIGNIITGLSNLLYTQHGVQPVTLAKVPSAGLDTFGDKIRAMREKYEAQRQKATAMDRSAYENALKAWRTGYENAAGLDLKAAEGRRKAIKDTLDAANKAADREYKRERDKAVDDRWNKEFDEKKRRSDRDYNLKLKQHNDNVSLRREQAKSAAARGVRGKQLGFADGQGNQVSIYENVWKGSMPSVYDILVAEGIGKPNGYSDKFFEFMMGEKSASEKDSFVKENWYKSQKAKNIMLALSKLDPATMTSELDDEVIDYVPGGSDDDVIDYIPGKNK